MLGEMYRDGLGTKKDPQRAAELFLRAAEPKYKVESLHEQARVELGILYTTGVLGNDKRGEAKKWFELAAEGGSSAGQFWFGNTYEKIGTPKALIEANKWFLLSMRDKEDVIHYLAEVSNKNVEKQLTDEEVAVSHRLARQWRPNPRK
jgi:TPR repeat protein